MFEKKSDTLASRGTFLTRLAGALGITFAIAGVSLLLGSAGYHFLADLPWLDALLNASMILTGMGPVDRMQSSAGKLFAAAYALYSGVAFITMSGVVVAPIFHRVLHTFHLDVDDESR